LGSISGAPVFSFSFHIFMELATATLQEVLVADAVTQLPALGNFFVPAKSLELLAAKNATLRLRAPSGHVYSFTDLTSANGAVNFGHLNPAIEAPAEPASDIAAGFYPPAAASYAAWLCGKLALDTHSVLYRVGKQAALSAVVAMAQRARPGKILTVAGSSHGACAGPVGVASELHGDPVIAIEPGADFTDWEEVSCLLYEPIQTAAGYVPLPLPWLRSLSQSAQAAGVLVCADEADSGFYRFGQLSLAASTFLYPDLYVFGKSMTNGVYPTFALVYPRSLIISDEGSSFQASSLGFSAAEAVARYIDAPDLSMASGLIAGSEIDARIAGVNRVLNQAGERLAANPALSAFHLAGPTLSLEVLDGRAGALVAACEANGVLIGQGGRRVRIAPPITIALDQLRQALTVLEKAATAI
jgi:acetylornithine/succinyldiaminopimelate/putrescine aminotransferase